MAAMFGVAGHPRTSGGGNGRFCAWESAVQVMQRRGSCNTHMQAAGGKRVAANRGMN